MNSKLAMNYRHFTKAIEHDTRIVHPRSSTYGSYDEDTTALILALTGLGLLAIATLSVLFAYAVL